MKLTLQILTALLAVFIIGCEQPDEQATADASAPVNLNPPTPVDPNELIGLWLNVSPGNNCSSPSGVMTCQPVAPGCSSIEVVPAVIQIESETRGGWFLNMENITVSGNQIEFQETQLVVAVELVDAKTASVDFGHGCKQTFELQ